LDWNWSTALDRRRQWSRQVNRRPEARHQYGLQVYATDDAMGRHAAALTAEQAPHLARFRAMTMDERWLDRPPEVMLDSFRWFGGEGFNEIVEDLLRLPAAPLVVAEGFRLLPRLVAPLLSDVRKEHDRSMGPSDAGRQDLLSGRGSRRG